MAPLPRHRQVASRSATDVPICSAQVDSCGARLGSLGRPGRTATGTALSDDEGGTASVVSDLRALLVTVGYSTLPFSDEASDVECDVRECGAGGAPLAFALVRDLERVTGIEPAWPAWKGGPASSAAESLTCSPSCSGVVCTPPCGGLVGEAGVSHGHQGGLSDDRSHDPRLGRRQVSSHVAGRER